MVDVAVALEPGVLRLDLAPGVDSGVGRPDRHRVHDREVFLLSFRTRGRGGAVSDPSALGRSPEVESVLGVVLRDAIFDDKPGRRLAGECEPVGVVGVATTVVVVVGVDSSQRHGLGTVHDDPVVIITVSVEALQTRASWHSW